MFRRCFLGPCRYINNQIFIRIVSLGDLKIVVDKKTLSISWRRILCGRLSAIMFLLLVHSGQFIRIRNKSLSKELDTAFDSVARVQMWLVLG